jgi:hypothetical protein
MRTKGLESKIKSKLVETKNKKISTLLEQKNLESRLIKVFGSEYEMLNFKNLPESRQNKILRDFMVEYYIISNGLITEQAFPQVLQKIFQGIFPSVFESLMEKLIYTMLEKIGLKGGFFHKFLTSFLATRPTELWEALNNCDAFTELLAKAISEAMVMKMSEELGAKGFFYDTVRNAIADFLQDQPFIDGLSNSLSAKVCEYLETFKDKAFEIMKMRSN